MSAVQHKFGHATHVGNVRSHNEDDLAFNPGNAIYVVADGMGGHASGEVASRITVKTVLERYDQERNLERAIRSAHQAVKMAASRGDGKRGMGTTVVAVALNESELDYAWVGDSRIYLWTDDELEQITKDHSYVQSLIDEGEITEREAKVHPKRNIITQCIGSQFNEELQVGCAQVPIEKGDRILMCSDGLTAELSDNDIASVMASQTDPQGVADALIQSCLARRASDNITVIVIDIVDHDPNQPEKHKPNSLTA